MTNLEQKLREYVELNASEIYNGINPDCRKSFKAGAELLLPMLVEALDALEGKHKNCNYLAIGHCNKCGKFVYSETLKSINEKLEGVK